jgi:hypothetical protein
MKALDNFWIKMKNNRLPAESRMHQNIKSKFIWITGGS